MGYKAKIKIELGNEREKESKEEKNDLRLQEEIDSFFSRLPIARTRNLFKLKLSQLRASPEAIVSFFFVLPMARNRDLVRKLSQVRASPGAIVSFFFRLPMARTRHLVRKLSRVRSSPGAFVTFLFCSCNGSNSPPC